MGNRVKRKFCKGCGAEMDEQAQARERTDAFNRAVRAAKLGDYAPIAALLFDMTNVPDEKKFDCNAQQDALNSDFSREEWVWSASQSDFCSKRAQQKQAQEQER